MPLGLGLGVGLGLGLDLSPGLDFFLSVFGLLGLGLVVGIAGAAPAMYSGAVVSAAGVGGGLWGGTWGLGFGELGCSVVVTLALMAWCGFGRVAPARLGPLAPALPQ